MDTGKSCEDGGKAGQCRKDKRGNMNCVAATNMCLGVDNSYPATRSKIQISSCDGGSKQKWEVKDGALFNAKSGKCLDIFGGCYWKASSCRAELYPCNKGANQKWEMKDGALINPHRKMCLAVPDGIEAHHSTQMVKCDGSVDQRWWFEHGQVHLR